MCSSKRDTQSCSDKKVGVGSEVLKGWLAVMRRKSLNELRNKVNHDTRTGAKKVGINGGRKKSQILGIISLPVPRPTRT